MKTLTLAILILSSFTLYGQHIVVDGDPIVCDGIIKSDSTLTSSVLYSKGIEWFATSYKNSKAVLQMQDKELGIIIGKAGFTAVFPAKGLIPTTSEFIEYTIKLQFKDGKLKYTISNFIPTNTMNTPMTDGKVLKWVPMAKAHTIRYVEIVQSKCRTEGDTIGKILANYFHNLKEHKDDF